MASAEACFSEDAADQGKVIGRDRLYFVCSPRKQNRHSDVSESLDRTRHGPETGMEEIHGDLLHADFGSGINF